VGPTEPAKAGAPGGYAHRTNPEVAKVAESLHAAIRNNDVPAVARQLARAAGGVVLEYIDSNGATPLMSAARCGNPGCMALLIDAGADLNSKDDSGTTALHMAINCVCPKSAVEILIAAGAQVNPVDNCGWTPLILAAFTNSRDSVKLLLDAGANMDHQDNNGMTALHYAIAMDRIVVTAILIEHKHLETIMRSEVVACADRVVPPELAAICGDYAAMTPERREVQARHDMQ
jgi:ankyrin repeat protein